MLYTPLTAESDRAIVEAVGKVAGGRGVSRSQIALAWLRSKPVVAAPIVGASKASQIDDAVASLSITLTGEELTMLESPYTPRHDFQGVSDDRDLQRIMAQIPNFATAKS
jgi:1-deoxyxylulose-5-phosphate synthase